MPQTVDKYKALQTFWSSFKLTAYDQNTVPIGATLPYLTYESRVADLDEPVQVTASVWYRSKSWEEASKKADEIAEYIKKMKPIKFDGGYIHITNIGQQRMTDEDDSIRRVVISVNMEFLSNW